MHNSLSEKSGRLIYIDILKSLSIIAVIILHVTGIGLMSYIPCTTDFNITLCVSSLFRFAVPVFVMCSGALFLNPEKQITVKKVFTKYISRIVLALIGTAILYEIAEILIVRIITGYFDLYVMKNSLNNLLTLNTHYHLYYLYIVVILYLAVPVLKTFLKSATEKNILYLISVLTVFSVILPFLRGFYPFNTYFTGMTVQYHLNLTYSMLTYFVLGYYLSHYSLSKKVSFIIYILGIAGLFTTFFGTYFSSKNSILNEAFLQGNSPNVFIFSVALFVFVKNINLLNKPLIKLFSFFSKSSFCIYLIHDLFIMILKEFNISILSFTPVLSVPLLTVIILTLSVICYLILHRIPLIKKIL